MDAENLTHEARRQAEQKVRAICEAVARYERRTSQTPDSELLVPLQDLESEISYCSDRLRRAVLDVEILSPSEWPTPSGR